MNDANNGTDEQSGTNDLEQRFRILEEEITSVKEQNNALKKENKQIKSHLDQQQDGTLPTATRRQTLAGLLGGGALLGAVGSASAAPSSGAGGPPFADKDHDHSEDYLGESKPVGRIDSGRVNATNELNNVEIVRPGDDIQAAIDSVHEFGDLPDERAKSEGNYSGMVRFLPNQPDNRLIYEFPDPPYVVRQGVTLDMRGIVAELTTDARILFDLQYGATVLGHGAYINAERKNSFTGACWYVSGNGPRKWNGSSMRNPVVVSGFPTLDVQGAPDGGATPILLESEGNGAIGGARFEVNCGNTEGVIRIRSTGGYINHNTVIARGAIAGGNAVDYATAPNSGSIIHNRVWMDQLQIKGPVERVLYCHGIDGQNAGNIKQNITAGFPADVQRYVSVAAAEWENGTGVGNALLIQPEEKIPDDLRSIDNSGRHGNYVGRLYSSGRKPFDLSQRPGHFDGEMLPDDGSNTQNRGVVCSWNDIEEVWVRPDGSTFFKGKDNWETYSIEKKSLSIDGDVSEVANVSQLSVANDFSVYDGDPSVNGPVWLTWDESNLYLAADLADNEHVQNQSVSKTWQDDCIQFGISSGTPGKADTWDGGDIALRPGGPVVYTREFPNSSNSGVMENANAAINRTNGQTRYEVALPWDALSASHTDETVSVALGIHDVDRKDNTETNSGWLEWGGGIFGGKNNAEFNVVKLTEN